MLKLSLHHFQTLHSTLLSWLYDTMKHTFKHTVIKCYKGLFIPLHEGFPVGTMLKNLPAKAGDVRDVGSIPGLGRSPGEGHGNPLQCSCLEKPMDWGPWRAAAHRVAKRWTWLKRLSTCTHARAHTHTHTQSHVVTYTKNKDIYKSKARFFKVEIKKKTLLSQHRCPRCL